MRQRNRKRRTAVCLAVSLLFTAGCTIEDRGAARFDYDQWYSSKFGPTAQVPEDEYRAEPEVRLTTISAGVTVTVARRWTTARTVTQACDDFRKGLQEVAGEVAEEDTGIASIYVLSIEHGRVTAVITRQPSGTEAVVLERKP